MCIERRIGSLLLGGSRCAADDEQNDREVSG
jgi:hypothetical protein